MNLFFATNTQSEFGIKIRRMVIKKKPQLVKNVVEDPKALRTFWLPLPRNYNLVGIVHLNPHKNGLMTKKKKLFSPKHFLPNLVLANSHPLANFPLSDYNYQLKRVKANVFPPRLTKSRKPVR